MTAVSMLIGGKWVESASGEMRACHHQGASRKRSSLPPSFMYTE